MKKFNFLRYQLSKLQRANFSVEIRIKTTEVKEFYPIRGIPEFKNGVSSIFEYQQEPVKSDDKGLYQRLPQVPYEIKEYSLKTFIYTFFLTAGGRLFSSFTPYFNTPYATFYPYIPATIFAYFYGKTMWIMYNSVTSIQLKEDGKTVIFNFKNNLQGPLEVEIFRIMKKKEENFLLECYTEPFLFPIEVDYTDIYGPYSLKNKRTLYLYGDSHKCIKNGEILRAIINSQNIKLK